MIEDVQARENRAWRKVIERETGKRYLTDTQIRMTTGVPPRRIREMTTWCRAMRRAIGHDATLPVDWWTARVTPVPSREDAA